MTTRVSCPITIFKHRMLVIIENVVKLLSGLWQWKYCGERGFDCKKKVTITDNVTSLSNLIQDRLSFKKHVSSFQTQVFMVSGIMIRVSKVIPSEIKLKTYYPFIHSNLMNDVFFPGVRAPMGIKLRWRR